MQKNEVYPTYKCGNLKILNYINAFNVEYEFIGTGYKGKTRKEHIIKGNVKDPLFPSVYGVGYLGVGDYPATVNRKPTPAYDKWQNMLQRCYDKSLQEKYPTYVGCTVCTSWLNFQNFAKWFYLQDYKNKHLDKDTKVKGNKLYSPETCVLISAYDNTSITNARLWKFVDPNGNLHEFTKLTQFCKEHSLTRENMRKVHQGKREHHKHWRKYFG